MNNSLTNLQQLRPTTFVPSIVRNLQEDSAGTSVFQSYDSTTVSDTSIGNTGSFRYDPIGSGVKSTQQLNVDWSSFANHTFFNSAQVKTNAAFDKIIDRFPFDGNKLETELYFDKLTGWERYVYDQFPKNKGYLFFSGSSVPLSGTFVSVKDVAGATFPTITRTPDGSAILNPGLKSMTFEFQLFVPSGSNSSQILLQKQLTDQGFTTAISASTAPNSCSVFFGVTSGSNKLSVQASVPKQQWNHVAVIWDRNVGQHRASIYVNQTLLSQSQQIEIGALNFDPASLFVGSGSAVSPITPTTTFSGALDELRIWHSIRTKEQRAESEKKSVFSNDDLVLYMKFNEPSGSNTDLVLDYSGKGIHGVLSPDAYRTIKVRNIATNSLVGPDPMTYERLLDCPLLFPDHSSVESLRTTLLTSASFFDSFNPNVITKLVPKHWFLEGQVQDALGSEEGSIGTDIDAGSTPNSVALGNTQILLSLLYVWATFFDEMKLHLDSFSNLIHVNYNQIDTVPDQFLQFLASRHGIVLPPLFVGTSIEQFINGENIDNATSNNDFSLQYLQNQIWRRILINLRDINSSKGTLHSIKSFIRATGIDPDNNFRIREYGGPTRKVLKVSRESRTEVASMANFVSGGYISSPTLSSSRVEPGFPERAGTQNDGLFTSGSWTQEGIYYFPKGTVSNITQSLARLIIQTPGNERYMLANMLAISGSGVTVFIQPNAVVGSSVLSMSIGPFDPMDGRVWNFSFGRTRGDQLGTNSSSFFLRAARSMYGEITEEFTTASWFDDNNSGLATNYFQVRSGSFFPVSGVFLEVGSGSTVPLGVLPRFLNAGGGIQTYEKFNGRTSQLRFWSKGLELVEWREHVRNFKSIGVIDPTVNFNFETKRSGSFERIRLDVSTDQPTITSSIGGTISLFDFSQNNLHMSGTGFPATSSVIVPHRFYYGQISPKFDEAATDNKVRIRSFSNFDNVLNDENQYAQVAPVYEIVRSEEPIDSNRFTIDFSIVDALNQDIVCIFANLDAMDNALGSPALMFSPDYPTLDVLRNLYFNRLTGKMNLKAFFEFYRWFDTTIGSFISQLVPRRTKYLGTNFVIESHLLERAKLQYHFEDIYLGDNMRHGQKDVILLQLFVGTMKKY